MALGLRQAELSGGNLSFVVFILHFKLILSPKQKAFHHQRNARFLGKIELGAESSISQSYDRNESSIVFIKENDPKIHIFRPTRYRRYRRFFKFSLRDPLEGGRI